MGRIGSEYDRKKGPRSWDALIGELAGRQHGVVALRQLIELGVPAHLPQARLRAERWYPLYRGVYAVGHRSLTQYSRYLAAVFACGPGARLSHRSAGALRGLIRWDSATIEVTAPRGRSPKPGIRLHRSRLIQGEAHSVVAAIPVTSVARTLVDLAEVLDEERLAKAVHRAEVLRVFDLGEVTRVIKRQPGHAGRRRLTRVLTAYEPEPHFLRSQAERLVKRLCTEHAVPMPRFNTWVAGYEVDAFWPEAKLALEFDGAATHHTRHAFHADRRRDRALAAEGVQVTRVTWPDLDAELARQVKEILRRR